MNHPCARLYITHFFYTKVTCQRKYWETESSCLSPKAQGYSEATVRAAPWGHWCSDPSRTERFLKD